MRWQKTARLAIAAFVLVFVAVVFMALRRQKGPAEPATSPRLDKDAVVETLGKFNHTSTRDGKILWGLAGDRHVTYADGRTRIENATLTLPDRNGQTVSVRAERIDVAAHPDKPDELRTAKAAGNVRLETTDGLVVNAAEAVYEEGGGVLTVPGQVQFTRGRMRGSGTGATYDKNRDVLWLLANATVSVTPDAKGAGGVEARAQQVGLARAEHYLKLTGSGHIEGEGRVIDADDIRIDLTDDNERVRSMALRGNSRISGGAAGAQQMAAVNIDLAYAADGRALQRANLMENASVQLPGTGGAPGRQIRAQTIELGMAPDGSTVTSLNAQRSVVLNLPPEGNVPGKEIRSDALVAAGEGDAGLKDATFTGHVDYRESRPAAGTLPAIDRTAKADRLIVVTQPGLGAIQQADFRGRVSFVDKATSAEAPRGLYRVVQDAIDLSPGNGEPGPAPSVNDGRISVKARTISLGLGDRRLIAETDVRSAVQPGTRDGEPGKVPSILERDEPVNITSNRLEYDGAAAKARYQGKAKLWQGKTSVDADTIELDDRSGNLTATGNVRTVMFFDDVDPKTKERKPAQTTATSHAMVYEDAKRLATYTTGPSAKAHIVGPQGDVVGDSIQLFLQEKANELERAEADGHVIVQEGGRYATGDHLTYTSGNDTYVMTGAPVHVEERTPPDCRQTDGQKVIFRRAVDTITIESNGIVSTSWKPLPGCGTERRR